MESRLPSQSMHPFVRSAAIALIFLGCANVLSRRMVDPDLWGHIQYAEDWIDEGALPRTASHTFSDPSYTWINHENLSELALAFGHRTVGGMGLMIGKAGIGLGMLICMVVLAVRRGVNPVLATALMFPVSGGVAEFWCARPQLASFIGMAALIVVLDQSFKSWYANRPSDGVSFRALVFTLPILLIWTNSHGGFLAGIGVFGAYLGLRGAEALWRQGTGATKTVLCLGTLGLAAVAVTLINPYGIGLHMWLLSSLGSPRPEISEWVSIPNAGVTMIPYFVLVVLTAVGYIGTKQRRDPVQMIVMALVAVQAFMHCRHMPFVAILFGFWMPIHLHSVSTQLAAWFTKRRTSSRPGGVPVEPEMTVAGTALLATESVLIAGALIGGLFWQYSQFGVQRNRFPVSAIQYMADHDLNGRVIVNFNWAQYTLAALPNSLVSFDGRFRTCYSQRVVDMNFDLTLGNVPGTRNRDPGSGPYDPQRVLGYRDPELVLIDRVNNPVAVGTMDERSDWTLLYQDQLAQLYGTTARFGNPRSTDFVPPEHRQISDEPQTGIASWPAMPGRTGRSAFIHGTTNVHASSGLADRTKSSGQTQPGGA